MPSSARTTLPAELRPSKHLPEPDPADPTSCLRCGAINGLHLEAPGEFDTDDPQPEPCRRGCPHFAHVGECEGAYPGGVPCRCGAAA